MQEKITFSQLCSMVSTRASVPRKVTEEYLRAFFSAIGDALARGETVKIKGLGTFKTTKIAERRSVNVTTGQEMVIPAHNRITFTPAPAMAQAVNAPFSAFEAVELADDFTDADLAALDNPPQPQTPAPIPEESPSEPARTVSEEDVSFEEIIPSPALESESETVPPPAPEPLAVEDTTPPALPPVTAGVVAVAGEKRKMRFTFWGGFCSALALVAIAGGLIILFLPDMLQINPWPTQREHRLVTSITQSDVRQETAEPLPTDEAAEKRNLTPVTEPGEEVKADQTEDVALAEPVYDTISKTRYLTTMAKEHYGNYHFWPYIYEENKAFLGHPDRIKPGTRVVVPPLSKYGVDPDNPDDVREAKRRGVAIYARYQK